jgi:hypothetical protein
VRVSRDAAFTARMCMPCHAMPRHARWKDDCAVVSVVTLCSMGDALVCDICWALPDALQSAFSMLERHVASGMMQPNMLPDAHLQPNMLHAAC